ncbi:TRAP transporter permease [Salininema proteolyticum]|uniref:TRAP transporter permease n=1 Tax=Salininema proteolyticum TaxID=1607685 RepID=A0ABV8U101_9ACTN
MANNTAPVRKDDGDPEVAYDREQAAEDIHALADAEPLAEPVGNIRHDNEISPWWKWTIWTIALAMALFQFWTGWKGILPTNQMGPIHLGFGLALIFLVYKPKYGREWGREPKFQDGLLNRVRGYLFGTEAGRGLVWTALLLGALAYVAVTFETPPMLILPAVLLLIVIQSVRYLKITIGGIPPADVLLAALGAWAAIWSLLNPEQADWKIPGGITATAAAAATVGLLLVCVAAVRAVGMALGVVVSILFAFAFFGPNMPDVLWHGGMDPTDILTGQFLTTGGGVFGTPLQVSYDTIFLFMIFAALLQSTGMEKFFTNLALAMAGKRVGGTAKVGVITSVFSGMITGSSVANTVSNGAFTIPMMKRSGYRKEFAGAVEAASSTGGQITPPIMGAGAFLMLALIGRGVGYDQIIAAAIVPAILFFVAQYIIIHFISKREGIMGLPKEELPKGLKLLMTQGYLLLPLIIIVIIISSGMTAMAAAFRAILWTIGINLAVQLAYFVWGMIKTRTLVGDAEGPAWKLRLRGGARQWQKLEYRLTVPTLLNTFVNATKMALPIIAATAAAGIISGILNYTGVSIVIGSRLVDLGDAMAGGIPLENAQLYLVLFFTMIACLILGIGLPTTANFVVMFTVAVPTIVDLITPEYSVMGIPEVQIWIAASLFAYYFGVLADITPPVCLAAFAAAGISGGSAMKTGVESVRIAISGFIVPFAFVLNPAMLGMGGDWGAIAFSILTSIIGVASIGAALAGFLDIRLLWYERTAFIAAGLLLLSENLAINGVALAVAAAAFASHHVRKKASGHGDSSRPTATMAEV